MSAENNESSKTNVPQSRDSLVGTTLGDRFHIEEVLGSGGMSVVYKAKQLAVNRHVAIKTIRMQLDSKPVYRDRFEREISSLCSLNHPNIVTVYDCIIGPDGQPYVVMDYLRGRSLESLIEAEGPLPINRFAKISMQVCSAMDHAHKRGIIHRDLKPGNIVLMDDEMDFVKVVDFGLAKLSEDNRKLTQSGELWGSPPYMSPEQCMGESGDERSDIYALGCVMYEMLTGKDPFWYATTIFELIQRHVNTIPASFAEVNPAALVPYAVESVIFQALEKDPMSRFSSALELREALVSACADSERNSGELYLHPASPTRSGSFSSGGGIGGGGIGGAGIAGGASSGGAILPSTSADNSERSEKSQQMAWFAGMLQTGADELLQTTSAEPPQVDVSSDLLLANDTQPEMKASSVAKTGTAGLTGARSIMPANLGVSGPPQPRSKWARPTGDEDSETFSTDKTSALPKASNTVSTSHSFLPEQENPPVKQRESDPIQDILYSETSANLSNAANGGGLRNEQFSKQLLPLFIGAIIIFAGIAIVFSTTASNSASSVRHKFTTRSGTAETPDASADSSEYTAGESSDADSVVSGDEGSNHDSTDNSTYKRPNSSSSQPADGSRSKQSNHLNKPKRSSVSALQARPTRPAKVNLAPKPQATKPSKSADPWQDLRRLQGH